MHVLAATLCCSFGACPWAWAQTASPQSSELLIDASGEAAAPVAESAPVDGAGPLGGAGSIDSTEPVDAAQPGEPGEPAAPASPALKSQWQSTLILHAYGCLSQARLAEALTQANQPLPPSDVVVHVIERVGNSVQIRLVRDHRELGQRDVVTVGETCPAILEATALLVGESLATVPTQVEPQPATEPTQLEPFAPEDLPPKAKAPTPPPDPRSWTLIAGVGWATFYSARFSPQLELLAGHRWGRPEHWGAELRLGTTFGWGRIKDDAFAGAQIKAQSWSGLALGCALFPRIVGLCLGATVGVLRGQGDGFDEDFSSDASLGTLVGQVETHLPLGRRWGLHWTARGQYLLKPPVFVIEQQTSELLISLPRWSLLLQAGARYWF